MEAAVQAVQGAQRLVVFSGAGMSADSGIGTFRSKGSGVWNGIRGKFALVYYGTPFGWSITPQWGWKAFIREFYTPIAEASPNAGHMALARLQRERFRSNMEVITMNVDGLHQAAGSYSHSVHEVHGTVRRFRCVKNNHSMEVPLPITADGPVPKCPKCGSTPRPDCTLFTESLPQAQWSGASRAVGNLKNGDVMLVVGTSSVVYPAASLPEEAATRGATVIEVNLDSPTPLSEIADISLQGKAAEVLTELLDRVLDDETAAER